MCLVEKINHNKETISLYMSIRDKWEDSQRWVYNSKIFELIQENIEYYKRIKRIKNKPKIKTNKTKKSKTYKWFTFVTRDSEYEEKWFNAKDFGYENYDSALKDMHDTWDYFNNYS